MSVELRIAIDSLRHAAQTGDVVTVGQAMAEALLIELNRLQAHLAKARMQSGEHRQTAERHKRERKAIEAREDRLERLELCLEGHRLRLEALERRR